MPPQMQLTFETNQKRGRSAEGWWHSPAGVWVYGCGDTVGIFIPLTGSCKGQLRIFNGGREYFYAVERPDDGSLHEPWNAIRDKIKLQLSAKVREIEEYANREP